MPTEIDGVVFASMREAHRYQYLRDRLSNGEIAELKIQPRFELTTRDGTGVAHVIGEYRADFSYQEAGRLVVEDAKGLRTALYQWKRKHVMAEHGIDIQEV